MAKKTISSDYTTWTGTSKKDKVHIDYADNVSVNTGKGNDSIYNDIGYYATINAGSGNDTIELYSGDGSSINAGSGNDLIDLYGHADDVTVKGGTGDDTIYGNGYDVLYQYKSGDGNDLITGWSSNGVIKITGGTYTKETVGNDVILTVGKGSITLKDAANTTLNIDGTLAGGKNISNTKDKKKLTGTKYADTFTNSGSYVTISGGKGKDRITNTGSRVSINSGDGNDWIFNEIVGYYAAGSRDTINTGAGDDTVSNDSAKASISTGTGNDSILNYGANSTVKAGSGNDKIINQSNSYDYGSNVSINAGSGNDTIWNNGGEKLTIIGGKGNDSIINTGTKTLYKYANGDGKDIITGFSSTDTLKITGAKYTRSTVGNDVVLKVGKGSVTLKDAANTTINIQGTLKGGNSNNVSIPSRANGDPNDALTYNGHSYYIYSDVANTWEEAQAYCEARGGHLAVINDNDENHMLFIFMKAAGYNSAYFGLSDAAREGTWTWVNGDSSTYRNWASGEPNSESSNEDYAEFYYKFSDGKWNDGNFKHGTVGDTRAFICEWDTINNGNASNDELWGNNDVDDFIHSSGGNEFGNDTLKLDSLNFTGNDNLNAAALKFNENSSTLSDFTATTFNANDDAYKIISSATVKK